MLYSISQAMLWYSTRRSSSSSKKTLILGQYFQTCSNRKRTNTISLSHRKSINETCQSILPKRNMNYNFLYHTVQSKTALFKSPLYVEKRNYYNASKCNFNNLNYNTNEFHKHAYLIYLLSSSMIFLGVMQHTITTTVSCESVFDDAINNNGDNITQVTPNREGELFLFADNDVEFQDFLSKFKNNKRQSMVLFLQANMLYEEGFYTIAEKYIRWAIICDPDNFFAYNILGKLMIKKGELEAATEAFESAVLHTNGKSITLSKLAWHTWINCRDVDTADKLFMQLTKSPATIEDLTKVAIFFWQEKEDRRTANEIFKKISHVKQQQNPDAILSTALFLTQGNKRDQRTARRFFEKSLNYLHEKVEALESKKSSSPFITIYDLSDFYEPYVDFLKSMGKVDEADAVRVTGKDLVDRLERVQTRLRIITAMKIRKKIKKNTLDTDDASHAMNGMAEVPNYQINLNSDQKYVCESFTLEE